MLNKPTKIRSKKIRESAQGEQCTLRIPGICNHNNETVVLCHVNSSSKGIANKSHDIHGVYACSSCHDCMDGRIGQDMKLYKQEEILRALLETQNRMIQKGLINVE